MEGKTHVLLCDDEPDFLKIVSFHLQSQGYRVSTVSGGEEAIVAVRKDPPDILFLDIRMSGIDGLETLRRIRKFNKDLPVVLLSANYQDERSFLAANKLGASGFFPKIGPLAQLTNVIRVNCRVDARPNPPSA